MKNKIMKNLIFLFVLAVSIFGVNYATASAALYYDGVVPYGYNTGYPVRDNYTTRQQMQMNQYAYEQQQLQAQAQLSQQQYYNDQQKLIQEQNLAIQKQNIANMNNSAVSTTYLYAQPKVQYVAAPTTTQYIPQQQVQYVAQPTTISYVPASNQGASVARATTTYVNNTNPLNPATGQYVSYDANSQAASVYGYNGYGNGQVIADPSYDPNAVTALSMNGSGSFLPSSVFQWFMFILLMLAIVIVVRIIIRKRAHDNINGAPTH